MAELKINVSKKNLAAAKVQVIKDGTFVFDCLKAAKSEDRSKYVKALPATRRLIEAVNLPTLTLIMAGSGYNLALTDKGKPKAPNGMQRLWDVARAAEGLIETEDGEEIPLPDQGDGGEPCKSWEDALKIFAIEDLTGYIRAARGPSKTAKRKTVVERAESWVKRIHKAVAELGKGQHKPANKVAGRVDALPGFNAWDCLVAYHDSPLTPMGVSFPTADDAAQVAATDAVVQVAA